MFSSEKPKSLWKRKDLRRIKSNQICCRFWWERPHFPLSQTVMWAVRRSLWVEQTRSASLRRMEGMFKEEQEDLETTDRGSPDLRTTNYSWKMFEPSLKPSLASRIPPDFSWGRLTDWLRSVFALTETAPAQRSNTLINIKMLALTSPVHSGQVNSLKLARPSSTSQQLPGKAAEVFSVCSW